MYCFLLSLVKNIFWGWGELSDFISALPNTMFAFLKIKAFKAQIVTFKANLLALYDSSETSVRGLMFRSGR